MVIMSLVIWMGALAGERGCWYQLYWQSDINQDHSGHIGTRNLRLQTSLRLRIYWRENSQNLKQGSSGIKTVLSALLLRQGNCVLLLSTQWLMLLVLQQKPVLNASFMRQTAFCAFPTLFAGCQNTFLGGRPPGACLANLTQADQDLTLF